MEKETGHKRKKNYLVNKVQDKSYGFEVEDKLSITRAGFEPVTSYLLQDD